VVCGGEEVGKMREKWERIAKVLYKILLRAVIWLVIIEFLTINVK